MEVVHISDIHFGSSEATFGQEELLQVYTDLMRKCGEDVILLISGDVTFKGSDGGFELAKKFFAKLIDVSGLKRKNILLCPGNHDLQLGTANQFQKFTDFSYSLRRDSEFSFVTNSFVKYTCNGTYFLVVNSAYHLDKNYGLVDPHLFQQLEQIKKESISYSRRIFVVHHHLINIAKRDISCLRNAYPLLFFLDQLGFHLILHGHQHVNQDIPIGNSGMKILSARSANFCERGGVNGVNVYRWTSDGLAIHKYMISNDANPTKLMLREL